MNLLSALLLAALAFSAGAALLQWAFREDLKRQKAETDYWRRRYYYEMARGGFCPRSAVAVPVGIPEDDEEEVTVARAIRRLESCKIVPLRRGPKS